MTHAVVPNDAPLAVPVPVAPVPVVPSATSTPVLRTYSTVAVPSGPMPGANPTLHEGVPPSQRLAAQAPVSAAVTSGVSQPSTTLAQKMSMPGWSGPGIVTIPSPRGAYEVGRQVGAGHFGAVYECLGPFDQRYAMKVLRPTGRPIEKVREEWSSEVRRLLQLRHPNVVYIHDAFEWQGMFCVALEWCDHTLKEMLEQALQEELAIELSRQMLAAVQYLHDWDLVHDDLHPGNVLIQQADRPIVKISDFGISAELYGATTVRPEVVHHAIMAPELLAVGYTSKQSDLYQLGMIMYWMIAGESPIQMDIPYNDLVQQISEGVARQRAELLGTPLGNIVAKMLRRRDAYRYTSAREVWMDLRELPTWRSRQIFHAR